VVQGALELILEPIFEADFQPRSFGYRPKKAAHTAIQRVSTAILEGKTYVIDFDLRSYFDTVRHHIVLEKVTRRVDDDAVLWLLKLLLDASGKQGGSARRGDFAVAQQSVPHRGRQDAGKGESSDPARAGDGSRIREIRR
jgi:retron-type reverse transcriptase